MLKKRKPGKYTVKDVASIVDMEGLDYAIQSYMGSDKIADPELAELWEEAGTILSKIEKILETSAEEENEDDEDEE